MRFRSAQCGLILNVLNDCKSEMDCIQGWHLHCLYTGLSLVYSTAVSCNNESKAKPCLNLKTGVSVGVIIQHNSILNFVHMAATLFLNSLSNSFSKLTIRNGRLYCLWFRHKQWRKCVFVGDLSVMLCSVGSLPGYVGDFFVSEASVPLIPSRYMCSVDDTKVIMVLLDE